MLKLLVNHGARLDSKTPDGRTALDLAREYGHDRFVPLLTGKPKRNDAMR